MASLPRDQNKMITEHKKVHCVGPEKIHTYPMEGHWKFLGGGGVLKAKFLEEMYENKLEFPGGRGVQNKGLSSTYAK